jgi:hypothetical protein
MVLAHHITTTVASGPQEHLVRFKHHTLGGKERTERVRPIAAAMRSWLNLSMRRSRSDD